MTDSESKPALTPGALAIPLFSVNAHNLTKADVRIANIVAEHFKAVLTMTISELAAQAEVSEITLQRFCKKLGCNGFQALKLALAQDSQTREHLDNVELHDSTEIIARKIFANITEGLKATLGTLDFAAVDRAARLISRSRRILAFGFGTSGTVCRDICIRFVRFGKSTELLTDTHQQATVAAMCDRDTVVIVVSLSGSSVDLLRNAQIAKDNGARIILITSHQKSPLAAIADEILVGFGPEISDIAESSVTRLMHMAVVDVLFMRMALLNQATYEHNVQAMRAALALFKS